MRRFTAFVLGLCLSLPVLAEQVQRFGDLDVHYNVFNSSFLQPTWPARSAWYAARRRA